MLQKHLDPGLRNAVVNVLGSTSDSPARLVLGPEPPDVWPTGQGYPAPFNQPVKEIKINLALGGNPGPLAPGAVGSKGATFEVDYIRITTL